MIAQVKVKVAIPAMKVGSRNMVLEHLAARGMQFGEKYKEPVITGIVVDRKTQPPLEIDRFDPVVQIVPRMNYALDNFFSREKMKEALVLYFGVFFDDAIRYSVRAIIPQKKLVTSGLAPIPYLTHVEPPEHCMVYRQPKNGAMSSPLQVAELSRFVSHEESEAAAKKHKNIKTLTRAVAALSIAATDAVGEMGVDMLTALVVPSLALVLGRSGWDTCNCGGSGEDPVGADFKGYRILCRLPVSGRAKDITAEGGCPLRRVDEADEGDACAA